MKVYLNEITGIPSAITSMLMSKRTWTREIEKEIIEVCEHVTMRNGCMKDPQDCNPEYLKKYNDWMNMILKWGTKHITLLKFIDMGITVEGLHRGGQDDWDSHAERYDTRIIRSSTRLAKFGYEMSDWYKGKIIPTDTALEHLNIQVPETIVVDGKTYLKCVNGYVLEEEANNKDVLRGLYMLSISSNFTFRVALTQYAHVYKERNNEGSANPEVKMVAEAIMEEITKFQPLITRERLVAINN